MSAETPHSMMAIAREVATQLIALDLAQRSKALIKLKEENASLHALVVYQISRIAKLASKPEKKAMAKEGPEYRGLGGTKLLHFDHDGKLHSLEVLGVEYRQYMATGDLHIEQVSGVKASVQAFLKVFSPKNRTSMLVIASSDGEKIIFQPPIAVASVNSSAEEKTGKLYLRKVLLKFIKEIVTLDLDGKEPDLEK